MGIVYGNELDCQRCPQRTLRRLDDVPEVKWNNLRNHQKRRVIECIDDEIERIHWITIDRQMLNDLDHSYALYNHDVFDIERDLAIIAIGYREMLFPIDTSSGNQYEFIFDQLFDSHTSGAVNSKINRSLDEWSVEYGNSRRIGGIQSADCVAGAASEDYSTDSDWLDIIAEDKSESFTDEMLMRVEHRLHESRTEP